MQNSSTALKILCSASLSFPSPQTLVTIDFFFLLFPSVQFSSVQSLSHVQLFVTPWTAACQASLSVTNSQRLHKLMSITNSQRLHKLMSIESVMPSKHLILWHPLSSFLQSFPAPQYHGLFQWVSSLHQMVKGLELQPQHQSLQWIFRTDFFEHWLLWSPCSARDSQESSPTPQVKSLVFLLAAKY